MKAAYNSIKIPILNLTFGWAVLLFCMLFTSLASAQLITEPLKREPTASKKPSGSLRKKAEEALTLPFWDDFSFTSVNYSSSDTLAGFPSDSLWQNSSNVWIKSGVEIDAPSVNVATLDGIDSLGNAYNSEPQANGYGDALISRPIDLSISQVSLAERGSVFLSFFYQWRGNGEPPDALDNFKVDFLNANKEWVNIAIIQRVNNASRSLFYDTLIKVNAEEFFHDSFQFRFRGFGRLSGPFDTWNLDYIYLDKGRSATEISFEDGALASPAGPLFGPYYGVPYKHFLQSPILGDVTLDVFNLRANQSNPDPYTYRTTGTFTSFIDGTESASTVVLTESDRPIRPDNPLLGPRERFTIETLATDRPDALDATQFNPDADSVFVDLKFLLLSNDQDFYTANDTVSARYRLKDFYAYDDGTAEYSVRLNEPDDQVAYRYDMASTESDIIVALDVFIPRHNVSGFLTGDFFVMNDVGGLPGQAISSVSSIIRKTDRDEFQRIHLSKPVTVQNSFYIGWKGSYTSILYVGKDTDTNTADRIFVNSAGIWYLNNTVEGSLMLRPVFGGPGPINGIEDETNMFDVYPNPSQGAFYVKGRPDDVELISTSGSKVLLTREASDDGIRVTMVHKNSGLYLLKIRKGSAIETHKVIVR
jgi:hypothetical protein